MPQYYEPDNKSIDTKKPGQNQAFLLRKNKFKLYPYFVTVIFSVKTFVPAVKRME